MSLIDSHRCSGYSLVVRVKCGACLSEMLAAYLASGAGEFPELLVRQLLWYAANEDIGAVRRLVRWIVRVGGNSSSARRHHAVGFFSQSERLLRFSVEHRV